VSVDSATCLTSPPTIRFTIPLDDRNWLNTPSPPLTLAHDSSLFFKVFSDTHPLGPFMATDFSLALL